MVTKKKCNSLRLKLYGKSRYVFWFNKKNKKSPTEINKFNGQLVEIYLREPFKTWFVQSVTQGCFFLEAKVITRGLILAVQFCGQQTWAVKFQPNSISHHVRPARPREIILKQWHGICLMSHDLGALQIDVSKILMWCLRDCLCVLVQWI